MANESSSTKSKRMWEEASPNASRIYVGNLPFDATEVELREVFSRMGPLKKVWLARRPPGFAFIHYKRLIDAKDAVEYLNGTKICGLRARVELCEDFDMDEEKEKELVRKVMDRSKKETKSDNCPPTCSSSDSDSDIGNCK